MLHNATPNTIQPQLSFEEWRDIPGYEGTYQASNYGRIRSLDRRDARGSWRKGTVLAPGESEGYLFVHLCQNGKRRVMRVHVLVALVFVGERPEGYLVNHIDTKKTNNHADNLEYLTPFDNTQHAVGMGLFGKLSKEDVWEIRAMYLANPSLPLAAATEKFAVDMSLILLILQAKRHENLPNPDGSMFEPIARFGRTRK